MSHSPLLEVVESIGGLQSIIPVAGGPPAGEGLLVPGQAAGQLGSPRWAVVFDIDHKVEGKGGEGKFVRTI